jgi:hypothetical protein
MSIRIVFSLIALLVVLVTPAAAQTEALFSRVLVVGSDSAADAPTSGAIMRVLGNASIGSASGTLRPWVIDSGGNVFTDNSTTVTNTGQYTFGADHLRVGAGTGTALFRLNGAAASDKAVVWLDNGTEVARLSAISGGLALTGRSITNANTSPFLRFSDTDATAGFRAWALDASNGNFSLQAMSDAFGTPQDVFRIYRRSALDDFGPAGSPTTLEIGGLVRKVSPATPSFTRLGDQPSKFLSLDVDELRAQTFIVNETQAFTNAALLVSRGSNLTRNLSSSATVVFVKHKAFRYLDFLVMRALGANGQPQAEWMRVVVAGAADCTGAVTPLPTICAGINDGSYAYTVERDKEGSGAGEAWLKGDAIVSSDRYLELFSTSSATIPFGSAVMGDRPQVYVNFDTATASVGGLDRAQLTTASVATLSSGASTGGNGGFTSTTDTGGGAWTRTTDGEAFSYPASHLGGSSQGAAMACSFSIEMVYYVSGSTPGAGYAINPVYKADPGDITNTGTWVVYHFGSGAGVDNGKMALYGKPTGSAWTQIGPAFTPSPGWHHIVWSYSSQNGGRVFNDSVEAAPRVAPQSTCMTINTQPIRGNLWGVNGNSAGGHWSELAVYAYDLQTEQIAAHYRALRVARPGMQTGPTIAGSERTSDSLYYGVTTRWACGNLLNYYGYQQTAWGCAFGDQGATMVSADATNGFRVLNNGVLKTQWDASGNGFLTGDLNISTSGNLRSGATGYDTGTGYWLDYNGGSPRFRIGTTSAGTSYLRWTGSALELKSATATINANGVTLAGGTSAAYDATTAYKFDYGDGLENGLSSFGTLTRILGLKASRNGATRVSMFAENTSGTDALIAVNSQIGATPARIDIEAPSLFVNGVQGATKTCTALPTVVNGIITSC